MRRNVKVLQLVVLSVGGFFLLSADILHAQKTSARKPNVILILADDLGYGDLGCYGQKKIQTPHIDRLAAEGIRFTNHYAGSTVCAPSRCSLLTGKHTGHIRVRGNVEVLMDSESVTVAEILRDAGYETAAIGKWGVGHPPPPGDPKRNGFGYFFGYLGMWHAHNYYPDFLWRNEAKTSIKGNVVRAVRRGGVALKKSQYSHDLFTDDALSYIEQNKEKPFFLYLPFTIPHANNEAGVEGMEVPDAAAYNEQDWPQAQKNHAAMITRLDSSVGRIVEQLKKLNLTEETLVFFMSDNGPHKEGGADPKFFQSSGSLRGHKRDLYEGGIRVPLIASWPGKIKPGGVSPHICAFWDFLPTISELLGQKPPAGVDGISYLPTLVGKGQQRQHAYLYWEFHEGGSKQAVRTGSWKAVRAVGGEMELYNLDNDPGETRNVAAECEEIVKAVNSVMRTARSESALFPLSELPQPKKTASDSK